MSLSDLSIINCNVLNIKQTATLKDPWWGSRGKDERGHAIFHRLDACLRAGIYILAVYQLRGVNTLETITAQWAPAGDMDNKPSDYAAFLESKVKVREHTGLNLFRSDSMIRDRATLELLIRAMAEYEHLRGYIVPFEHMQNAITIYEHPNMNRPKGN